MNKVLRVHGLLQSSMSNCVSLVFILAESLTFKRIGMAKSTAIDTEQEYTIVGFSTPSIGEQYILWHNIF